MICYVINYLQIAKEGKMADKYKFLNIGFGDCTIMEIGSKVVMIDCHEGNVLEGQEDIISNLPRDKIDVLILTHQHYDHFDGIQTLLDCSIEVSEVWICPYSRRYGDNSVEYDEWQKHNTLVSKLVENGAKLYKPTRGTGIYDKVGGVTFQILGPPKNINTYETRELHDASLVLAAKKGSMTILFTGDASDWALDQVIDFYDLSKYHILHASHHGSINGANLDFIKTVSPNYTIVSTKSGVHENVPHATAMKRYRDNTKKAVRRTDVDGTRVFNVG